MVFGQLIVGLAQQCASWAGFGLGLQPFILKRQLDFQGGLDGDLEIQVRRDLRCFTAGKR